MLDRRSRRGKTSVMATPLLGLDHDWHRQRAQLRTGRMRPPPLVAAGLDVQFDPEHGRTVQFGGLAVIFGVFPASLKEFRDLVRARLHLGSGQAQELDAVLNTRILAMWAWLPTLRQDCYIELDRATGTEHLWSIGPGPGEYHELDVEDLPATFDTAFLDALVLNGPGHWGGEAGLLRLVERFGHQPLLVAAQIADLLDHQPRQLNKAMEIARNCWPALSVEDEPSWVALAEQEHPWVNVQVGRLALRLGLVRAARILLRFSVGADVQPVAHFDLGQANEALGDLTSAEAAFARYAAARPNDPDAWRRLLFCRLRLGHLPMAIETLKRYRAAGGRDRDLAERFLALVGKAQLPVGERAPLAGWLVAHIGTAVLRRMSLRDLVAEIEARRCGGAGSTASLILERAVECLRLEMEPVTLVVERGAEETLVVVLATLGLLTRPRLGRSATTIPGELADHAAQALALWSAQRLDSITVLPDGPANAALRALADLAASTAG